MSQKRARRAGHRALLEDENVKRWYDNVARGSMVTADVYLRRLGHLCSDLDMTPKKLLLYRFDIGL